MTGLARRGGRWRAAVRCPRAPRGRRRPAGSRAPPRRVAPRSDPGSV